MYRVLPLHVASVFQRGQQDEEGKRMYWRIKEERTERRNEGKYVVEEISIRVQTMVKYDARTNEWNERRMMQEEEVAHGAGR